MQIILYAFIGAYVLGSIPFGLLLNWISGGGDLRTIGSGNIGATNVLRTGKKGLAALTLILDLAKGAAAVLFAAAMFAGHGYAGVAVLAAALGAVLGHCFSIFLKFSGGKGVATYAGVALGLSPILGGVYAALWIGVLLLSRISSLGGLAAAIAMPISALIMQRGDWALMLLIISGLIVLKHSANIERLRAGTEPRIGKGGS